MPRITASDSRAQAQHILNVWSQLNEPDESKRRRETVRLTGKSRSQVDTALDVVVRREHLKAEKAGSPSAVIAGKLVEAATMPQPPKKEPTPAELLEQGRQDRSENLEVRSLKALLKESERQREEVSAQLDLAHGLNASPRNNVIITPPNFATSGKGVFVAVASDWHLEEDVDPETVNGKNTYNPTISAARAKKFFESFVFMLTAWRHIGLCDTAILAIIGDIISGYIHEELMESNHMSPIDATLFGRDLITAGIRYILDNTDLKQLIIPCCYGNHGRTTIKSRIQTGAANSYEYGMYRNMERDFRNEPRVKFVLTRGYHNIITVPGAVIRFHHGDQMRYNGGSGGITIPVNKSINQWNKGNKVDLDVFGHFHQLFDGGNFICNGSLIGYNAYALSIAASPERPRQACFWIDSKLGKTMSGELFVEV